MAAIASSSRHSGVPAEAKENQGRITGQELRHYSSLRDVAARQLAAGQFPLVFRGICAPTLPVGCFGANLPAATAAAPTPPPAAEPPATGVSSTLRASAPVFVPAAANAARQAGEKAQQPRLRRPRRSTRAAVALSPAQPTFPGAAGPGQPPAAASAAPVPPLPSGPAKLLVAGGRAQEREHLCRLLREAAERHKVACACSFGASCCASHAQPLFPAPVPYAFVGNMVPEFQPFRF